MLLGGLRRLVSFFFISSSVSFGVFLWGVFSCGVDGWGNFVGGGER